jgi:HEAT repeat protein
MRLRLAAVVMTIAMASVVRADDPQVAKLARDLSTGNTAAQLQAADDLAEFGAKAKPAVPGLIKALGSTDPELQWHAACTLGAIGPEAKDAVPALVAALKSSDANVRGHAAYGLEQIGTASQPAVPALIGLLGDNDPNVRRAAIDALVGIHLNQKTLIPILKQAIEDSNMDPSITVPALNALADLGDAGMQVLIGELQHEKGRYWACVALAEAGPKAKAAVPELSKLLAHKEPEIRMEAAIALGQIGPDSKTAAPQLIKALSDEQNSVRYAAAFAVGKIGVKDAVGELTKNLDSQDHFLRMVSAWSLAKLKPTDTATVDRAVKLLVDSLKDSDRRVRAAAARGLQELELPHETLVDAFTTLLADKDPEVRGNVVDALSTLGVKALPKLIKALENDDMQSLAVEVIRRLGPQAKDAVPALILELKDPDPAYRQEVEFALAAIGPEAKAAVPALLEHMIDSKEEPKDRYTACYALGKIGPAAAVAVPALRQNMAGDDKFLKVASVWALLHIQPEDRPLKALAVPLLAKALEESERDLVKVEVATALGAIGPTAQAAIPTLEKAAKDDDSAAVRTAAADALKKIRAGK